MSDMKGMIATVISFGSAVGGWMTQAIPYLSDAAYIVTIIAGLYAIWWYRTDIKLRRKQARKPFKDHYED